MIAHVRESKLKRIAIEEAFVTADIAREWKKVLARADVEPGFAKMGASILADTPGNSLLHARLLDIGEGRIAHMDEVGIDMQVLSLTSPGVQVLRPISPPVSPLKPTTRLRKPCVPPLPDWRVSAQSRRKTPPPRRARSSASNRSDFAG